MVKQLAIVGIAVSLLLSSAAPFAAELVLQAGVQQFDGSQDKGPQQDGSDGTLELSGSSPSFGLVLYNNIDTKQRHWLGAGFDYYELESMALKGFRAIDYQWRFSERFYTGAYIGAASLDSGYPQNGYYFGASLGAFVWQDKLSLKAELRRGEGLARDKLPDEQDGSVQPDLFLDFNSLALQLGWHF
ncbi:hypothetical protein [Agaribacterium haliotis]|uniref:hypothetical protein n=1 Tax=Agaribacterium haliotis TaxID=2013869 RepID=UPI000BB578AB|nr:hypothetical protein [Agaribacterium haliotis]